MGQVSINMRPSASGAEDMSQRVNKHHHLIRTDPHAPEDLSPKDRLARLTEKKMHGIAFSAYTKDQKPGDQLGQAQINRRLGILAHQFNWVRSFSTTEGNELIPRAAKAFGLQTLTGAWLGRDPAKNRAEINQLVALADEGVVDIAACGNEVLYRGDLDEGALLDHMAELRDRLPSHIPIGYVDAYYEFEDRPALVAASDVLLINCYPFWEGCALPYAILYMQDMYRRVKRIAQDKRVIISETGWPTAGGAFYGAESSLEGALDYFLRAMEWASEEDVEMFYFSSFDEAWKGASEAGEGAVGAHWGLWDEDEVFKYAQLA